MALTDQEVFNELLGIEAMAQALMQRATCLRKKLQPATKAEVSPSGLSEVEKAKLLGKFNKNIIKNKKAAGGTAALIS